MSILNFIFYKKRAKILWLQYFLQILSRKIRASGAGQNLLEILQPHEILDPFL